MLPTMNYLPPQPSLNLGLDNSLYQYGYQTPAVPQYPQYGQAAVIPVISDGSSSGQLVLPGSTLCLSLDPYWIRDPELAGHLTAVLRSSSQPSVTEMFPYWPSAAAGLPPGMLAAAGVQQAPAAVPPAVLAAFGLPPEAAALPPAVLAAAGVPLDYFLPYGVQGVPGQEEQAKKVEKPKKKVRLEEGDTTKEEERRRTPSGAARPSVSRRRTTTPGEPTRVEPSRPRVPRRSPTAKAGRRPPPHEEIEEVKRKPKRVSIKARGATTPLRKDSSLREQGELKRLKIRRTHMLDTFESRNYYHYELPTVCQLIHSVIPELFLPPCLSTSPLYEYTWEK